MVFAITSLHGQPVSAQDPCSEGILKDYQVAILNCTGDLPCGLNGDGWAPVSYNQWDPLSLTYPEIPDESGLIAKVQQFIQSYESSLFVSRPELIDDPEIGIFALSKENDVNPLLILSILKQENQFASSSPAPNNFFGMTETVNGSKQYRSFATPEEGIEFFIEFVGNNISDPGSFYRQRGVTNFYEYLNVHQMGFIAYPGEYPPEAPGHADDPPYLFKDSLMEDERVTWESEYSPATYYKNSIAFINAVTGMSLSDVPRKSGPCTPGLGFVNAEGYSFPLEPQRRIPMSDLPCIGTGGVEGYNPSPTTGESLPTCHHDGTPAFDLSFAGVAGKKVYALVEGEIVLFTRWGGTCQSIQLLGKDGYHYWYGHITSVPDFINVNELPQQVGPGQQIGVVDSWSADNTCKGTSSGSHLHIDRGRPDNAYGGMGGFEDGRDPDFIPLLEKIYQGLDE